MTLGTYIKLGAIQWSFGSSVHGKVLRYILYEKSSDIFFVDLRFKKSLTLVVLSTKNILTDCQQKTSHLLVEKCSNSVVKSVEPKYMLLNFAILYPLKLKIYVCLNTSVWRSMLMRCCSRFHSSSSFGLLNKRDFPKSSFHYNSVLRPSLLIR